MKLTSASTYAVHALVHMASQQNNQPLASHLTAQERGIPKLFLLKVLKSLVTRDILRSVKGPHGGYRLARPPRDITLLDIVEAVDGPVQGTVSFGGEHAHVLERQLQTICDQAAGAVRQRLQKVRLTDLMDRK